MSGEPTPTTEAGKGHDHYTQHASFCAFRAALDGPCTCHLTEQIVAIEAEARQQGANAERERITPEMVAAVMNSKPAITRVVPPWDADEPYVKALAKRLRAALSDAPAAESER